LESESGREIDLSSKKLNFGLWSKRDIIYFIVSQEAIAIKFAIKHACSTYIQYKNSGISVVNGEGLQS
jgi:hypothetical protein